MVWYKIYHTKEKSMYGAFLKGLRLEKGLSLRDFSRRIGEDPSNWSKVERGILPAPRDDRKKELIASVLSVTKGSEEWNKLEDYASVDSATIPDYIMNDKEALAALPAFFRTIGSVRPTQEEIEKLLEKLKET
jgi:transcriptional regulator with XRE-family HTH domain